MTQTKTSALDVLAKAVTISATKREPTESERREEAKAPKRAKVWSGLRQDWVDAQGPTYWTVTLGYQGRSMLTPFHSGGAITKAEQIDAATVLSCLITDGESVASARDFADWCADIGEDDDSIRAKETYEACVELGLRVRVLLGGDYEAFRAASEDY